MKTANSAGHASVVLSVSCPLGTGRDCCEWHVGGTVSKDDLAHGRDIGSNLDGEASPRRPLPRWQVLQGVRQADLWVMRRLLDVPSGAPWSS
jgi:hypothetical protein